MDLNDYWKVAYPNQWGSYETNSRRVIDESTMILDPIDKAFETRVKSALGKGALTTIAPRASVGYYREFNASTSADVKASVKSWFIVSFAGRLIATDGTTVEGLGQKPDDVGTKEMALHAPIPWKRIPKGSLIVRHP